jgi:hypothetical protein
MMARSLPLPARTLCSNSAVSRARVVVEDGDDLGKPVDHLQDLVDLLLVLRDHHLGVAVIDDVGDLVEVGILVDAHRGRARRLRGQLGADPGRPVVAEDGHLVAASDAQLHEAQRKVAHVREVSGPARRMPDAEPLLAQGRALAVGRGVAQQELGEGVAGWIHAASAPR